MYTIKTVTSLTGINTETLRAWERRYGTVIPVRDDKGRRLYTQQDIERLTLLSNATQQGFTISKIAEMSNAELQELVSSHQETRSNHNDLFFTQIIDALLNYRMDQCEELLRRALVAMEPLAYARDVLLPTLQNAGNLWHEGKLSIAQEHMLSACVKRIVLSLVNSMHPFTGPNPGIMFATLSGEDHEFGILLTCMLAVSQRCPCFYIGPDIPGEELLKASIQLKPAVIVLSCVTFPPLNETVVELNQLAKSTADETQLWIGGAGAQFLCDRNELDKKFIYTPSLDAFNDRLARLLNVQRARNAPQHP
ncbi:MAG: MerR family transcriptional regulator [Methylicorpusculum sp.]|uniref:MerR family transcriptional regulator n=1 Tax=Methylicorpusculum sp. TaxID=2713644 RepID=UPI00271F462C|nr:MerR family transcriptional regulator [Methylicorpusculum sp.]MDO8843428.1 MerR family transcriptional regulator [Methylicorpusculum sp.]MDO8941024.1 MerR family transcriptional regulator [Methylicorpusculum sp.]MDP2203879.1 MerR family transcriptional regulator [Methylicorpusculum sp.]